MVRSSIQFISLPSTPTNTHSRDVAAGICILREAGGLITTANPPANPETDPIQEVKLGSRLYLAIRYVHSLSNPPKKSISIHLVFHQFSRKSFNTNNPFPIQTSRRYTHRNRKTTTRACSERSMEESGGIGLLSSWSLVEGQYCMYRIQMRHDTAQCCK